MAQAGIFAWLTQAVDRAYERRIRRASKVAEYGVGQAHAPAAEHAAQAEAELAPDPDTGAPSEQAQGETNSVIG
jgi:hypothetical protein